MNEPELWYCEYAWDQRDDDYVVLACHYLCRRSTLDIDESESTNLSRLYRNEIFLEATFYTLAFSLTWVPILALYIKIIVDGPPSSFLLIFAMILSPLSGLFNVLVYTRQSIASLRRRDPSLSWLSRFWIVLKAGGELPSNRDASTGGDVVSSSVHVPKSDSKFDLSSDFASLPMSPPMQISEPGPDLTGLFRSFGPHSSDEESKPKRMFYN